MTKAQTSEWENKVREDAMRTHAAKTWDEMPTIEMHSYERIIDIFRSELAQQRKEDMERILELINNDYKGRDITIYELGEILRNKLSQQT